MMITSHNICIIEKKTVTIIDRILCNDVYDYDDHYGPFFHDYPINMIDIISYDHYWTLTFMNIIYLHHYPLVI